MMNNIFDAGPSRSASCSDSAMEFMAVRDLIYGMEEPLMRYYVSSFNCDSCDAKDYAIEFMLFLIKQDLSYDEACLIWNGIKNGIVLKDLKSYGVER